jgi:hypothetical protein
VSQYVGLFLTIHILTAIAAFGPTVVFPLIARMAAQEPQHGLFALHLTDKIEKRLVIPAALTMPISGSLLISAENIDVGSTHWLVLAIGLYVATIAYAIFVQVRTLDRMIVVAMGLAAAGPALAAGPGAALAQTAATGSLAGPASATAAAPSRYANPAQELAALGARVRNGGIFMTIMIVLIVSLMSGKPAI